ncbi:borealin-2-like isoform X2 [Eublepharis macularius]|uniref:Borealin-2-like isoform X2 n=1 Tax=Eublepharis macularius TaxID=481883 RepID=A0AA97KJR3_EUBMA|nr:borealin-2-like isoform X2 [Eublepharis macularius]
MALKKYFPAPKKRSGDSGVEPDRSLLSREQRHQRLSLFLQDFDHQAKEHLQAMKHDLEALLQTVEKAFRVELLTMPLVMRQMRRKDLLHLKEEEAAATVVAAVTANDCSVGDGPNPKLVRTGSKRVKVTTIVEYEDGKEESRSQGKKTSQKIFKTKSLASLASAFKGKHGASRIPQRGLSKSASETGCGATLRSASMPHEKAVPFVNIPLADGQTLCSAGDDLQNINVDLLNDDTVQHIHTLVSQLTVLCGKATGKPS